MNSGGEFNAGFYWMARLTLLDFLCAESTFIPVYFVRGSWKAADSKAPGQRNTVITP